MSDLDEIETEATALRNRLGEGKSIGVMTATDGAVLADLIKRLAKSIREHQGEDHA